MLMYLTSLKPTDITLSEAVRKTMERFLVYISCSESFLLFKQNHSVPIKQQKGNFDLG